jgi:dTDP-4-dehydrorhamnose 3,5-epimerase
LYKTTDYYDSKAERVIIWNDPTLNVPWPITPDKPPILSARDMAGKLFIEAELYE